MSSLPEVFADVLDRSFVCASPAVTNKDFFFVRDQYLRAVILYKEHYADAFKLVEKNPFTSADAGWSMSRSISRTPGSVRKK